MKYFYSLIFLLMLTTACRSKALSGKELENKLKQTMADHLHQTMKPGTEVDIKDVVFYPDKIKKLYLCTFTVEIRTSVSDTTGIMKAEISRDFKEVTRTQ